MGYNSVVANRKPMYNFLLLINSNLGRIVLPFSIY